MYNAGARLDPDLNKYDLNHVVSDHPTMSTKEWEQAYQACWDTYYSEAHIERIMRRGAANRVSLGKTWFLINWFSGAYRIEGIHPLECGWLRLKYRRDRRPGLPIENPLVFYPRYWFESVAKQVRWVRLWTDRAGMYFAIKRDPERTSYRDLSLTPPEQQDGEDNLAMFQTAEAQAYIKRERKMVEFRIAASAKHPDKVA
jgi:hypothetical protein